MFRLINGTKINYGGPVKRLQCIHSIPSCGGQELPLCSGDKQMYTCLDTDAMIKHLETYPHDRCKLTLYAGCCMWSNDEINTELMQGLWTPVFSFSDKLLDLARVEEFDSFWSIIMRKLGASHASFSTLPKCNVATVEDVFLND